MSREIKFRAWSTVSKKMIKQEKQGAWFTPNVDTNKYKNQSLSLAGVFNEETLIVEQYTGLKDEKGVEIYEGDIVYISGYGLYEAEFPFTELYDAMMESDIGEIKGNIHENSELLK